MNETASSIVIRYLKAREEGVYIDTKKRILSLRVYTSLESRELIFLKREEKKGWVEGNI